MFQMPVFSHSLILEFGGGHTIVVVTFVPLHEIDQVQGDSTR